jgi:hypothetical protein
MKASSRNLGIAAIVIGLYGLTPLPLNGWVAAIGAIVIGILLLTR